MAVSLPSPSSTSSETAGVDVKDRASRKVSSVLVLAPVNFREEAWYVEIRAAHSRSSVAPVLSGSRLISSTAE